MAHDTYERPFQYPKGQYLRAHYKARFLLHIKQQSNFKIPFLIEGKGRQESNLHEDIPHITFSHQRVCLPIPPLPTIQLTLVY